MDQQDKFRLYTFYSSSSCQRIIIAANLKSIPLEYTFINLGAGEHRNDAYRDVNPSASVPTLEVQHADGTKTLIRQSVAILEYFEERYSDQYPLLPPLQSPAERALIREFVGIIAIDTAAPTNSRIAKRVKAVRGQLEDQVEFVKAAFLDGFKAYEALLLQVQEGSVSRNYTFGESVTMADVCLVPAVDQALMYKMDLEAFPNLMRVYGYLKKTEAFQKADWRKQGDTPDVYRTG